MAIEYDDFGVVRASEAVKKTKDTLSEIANPGLITIGEVLKHHRHAKNISLAQELLRKVGREKLDALMRRHSSARNRAAVWLINCEYTSRRVPPVFRNLPDADPDQPTTLLDMVAYDLEWISIAYPKHLPPFQRYRKFMHPTYFHSQAKYIFSSGLRHGRAPVWKALKGLGFTVEQQAECHVLRGERIYNAMQKYQRLKPTVESLLEARHVDRLMSKASVVKLGPEDRTIIRRRTNIWYCAMLSDWSPSRTGRLYDALTGFPDHRFADELAMTRQRAAKFMDDVRRDLPKDYLK